MSPGWKKHWHVGIRVGETLCAFISAIPAEIRMRDKGAALLGSQLPLRAQEAEEQAAPTGAHQRDHTLVQPGRGLAGYLHRWHRPAPACQHMSILPPRHQLAKALRCRLQPCPPNSKPQYQVRKYALPSTTSTPGLREMEAKDVAAVQSLLKRYLDRFDLSPEFTEEEVDHWLLDKKEPGGERVVWSYVVEMSCSLEHPLPSPSPAGCLYHSLLTSGSRTRTTKLPTSSPSTASNRPSSITPNIRWSEPPTCSTMQQNTA